MKKFAGLLIVLAMTSLSFAGFINGTFQCTFPDDPTQAVHNWTFNYDTYDLNLAENLHSAGIDQVIMSGTTDEDPIFRTIKLVTNSSTVAWTSYELTLSATGPVFTGTPSSDLFSSAVISNGGLKITFSGGVVNPGDEVLLNFRTLVSSTGTFSVCLTQNPIPEPATIALLSIGALAFIRRK
jgi:hypothetical protein